MADCANEGIGLLEVTSLGSGSCGNALLIHCEGTHLLIDCGIGVRRLRTALATRSLALEDIDAVLLTHEHSDHVRELPRMILAHKTVVATSGSARATGIPSANWVESRTGRPVEIGAVEVFAVPVEHDAAEPCGFHIRSRFGSVTLLTDLGTRSSAAAEVIAASRLVVLEANHDEALLRRGPYPLHLQRRILSNSGHLSNDACGELLAAGLRGANSLPTVWLAHLSETNNRPALAKQTVERHLAKSGLRLEVVALPRRELSCTWSPESARNGSAQLELDFS